MLGVVPAVFTPGPPPAHMSSPGRPVARKVPPPALPAAEVQPSRSDAGLKRIGAGQGQGVEELLQVPVCPPERAAEAAENEGLAAGGATEPPLTVASPVTNAEDTIRTCMPPPPATLPAAELPQATAVSEADRGLRDAVELLSLPTQQNQRQQAAFDPRAAAVPLGQAAARTKQAASTASHVSDEGPRRQAAAGTARAGSLHAPLLPVRRDPGGRAPRGGARDSTEPAPTVREPAAAAPSVEAMAVGREQSTGVGATELSEQAAARASAEAAQAADDGMQLVSGLLLGVRQPASPRAATPAEGSTPAPGADDQLVAAEAATAPAALPTAAPELAVSDAAIVEGRSGASSPVDAPGMAARAQHASGHTDGEAWLGDGLHMDQRDGLSAGAKRHREVAAGDNNPSLAAEERPSKRPDTAAASSSSGSAIDVAAAVSVLLQVCFCVPFRRVEVLLAGHADSCFIDLRLLRPREPHWIVCAASGADWCGCNQER